MVFLYIVFFIELISSTSAFAFLREEKSLSLNVEQINSLSSEELRQVAQEGNPYAQYALAVTMERQRSPNSEKEAYYWYSKAAEKLNEAQYMLGRWHERKSEWELAFTWYSKAAKTKNDVAAQFKVAQFYERGLFPNQSNNLAFYWYSIISHSYSTPYLSFDEEYNKLLNYARMNALLKLASLCKENIIEHKSSDTLSYYLRALELDKNHTPSLVAVARIYESDNKIKDAINYYEQAADLQDSEAQYKIALFAYAERDYKRAYEFVIKACSQNYAPAHYLAGLMKEDNLGFEHNNEQSAYESYKQAALQGHESALKRLELKAEKDPHACYILGQMYENGIKGKKDREQAIFWYQKACAQKYALAFYALGCLYKKESNAEEAALNFSQAAHLGYSKANCKLGKYLEQGTLRKIKEARNIVQCYTAALYCYKAAYEKGYAKALHKVNHIKAILEDLKLLPEPNFTNHLFQSIHAHIAEAACPLDFFYWTGYLADVLKTHYSEKIQMTGYYLLIALLRCQVDDTKRRTLLKDFKRLLESNIFSNDKFDSKADIKRVILLVKFFKSTLKPEV